MRKQFSSHKEAVEHAKLNPPLIPVTGDEVWEALLRAPRPDVKFLFTVPPTKS